MANEGISIKQAMSKWHISQAQAEQLDKMDDDSNNGVKGNGKISGNIYDMAKTYYETHADENKNETNRVGLFNNLVNWIKDTKDFMNKMKNGTLFEQEESKSDSTENKAISE